METIIKCSSCNKELEILVTRFVPGSNNIIVEVGSCRNADCNDCSNCEDAKTLTRVLTELRELKTKLSMKGEGNAAVEAQASNGIVQDEYGKA